MATTTPPTVEPAVSPARDERTELITPGPAEALAGLLDISAPALRDGDELPLLWHWVYLLERRRQSDLGMDGHPTSGIPTPPEPDQIRMFAGGRVTSLVPIRFGLPATRTIWVEESAVKAGRSGSLTFVTTRAELRQDGELCLVDEQDIVYRQSAIARQSLEDETSDAAASVVSAAEALLELDIDPVVLFRFSALTYNAHRIHYDAAYAASEGYPDLVIHGPLQALLMGESFRRSDVSLLGQSFSYRLVAPTYGAQRIAVIAGEDENSVSARVRDGQGIITATSVVTVLVAHCA